MDGRVEATEIASVFLENRSTIGKIVDYIARRQGIDGTDAEDFASVVNLRLIEDDYAVLRKFRGESTLSTFLAVVIAGICRDFQVQRFGKWRPSTTARSQGIVAMRLETLLFRDHYPVAEAIERVRHMPECPESENDIRAIISRLPFKERVRSGDRNNTVPIDSASDLPTDEPEYSIVEERTRIEAKLNEVLTQFEPEDRLIIQMKYWSGISVADLSRILGIPQKQLYRRLEKLLESMKMRLRNSGVSDADVRDLVGI